MASPLNATTVINSQTIDSPHTSPETSCVANNIATLLPIDPIDPPPAKQTPPGSHPLSKLVEALDTGDRLIATMVAALAITWSEVNNKGTTVTKRKLDQCVWEAHPKSDGIQNL